MSDDTNVIHLNMPTRKDIPASVVVEASQREDLDTIIVLGFTKDGEEYFASSVADGGTILWLIERLKKKLLEYPDEV